MPMTPHEIIKLLESNGFVHLRTNGSHLFFRNPQTGRTKGMEQKILKDAGLK